MRAFCVAPELSSAFAFLGPNSCHPTVPDMKKSYFAGHHGLLKPCAWLSKYLKLIPWVFCPPSIGRSSVVLGEPDPPTWKCFYLFRANRNNQKDFQQLSPVICQLCWWCMISSHQKKTLWCFSWAVVPSVDEILAVTTLRKHDLLWRVSPTFSQPPAESCQQEERPHKTGLSENCVGQAFFLSLCWHGWTLWLARPRKLPTSPQGGLVRCNLVPAVAATPWSIIWIGSLDQTSNHTAHLMRNWRYPIHWGMVSNLLIYFWATQFHLHCKGVVGMATCRGVRYIDKPYRLSIYRHVLKISISISI